MTDQWDGDLCAIGIRNLIDKKHLIYISTYNKPHDYYFVEIEAANNKTDLTDYTVIEKFDEISFKRLSELVAEYLHLKPIYEK